MFSHRQPDGLSGIARLAASLLHEMRADDLRRRVMAFQLAFFGILFVLLVTAETFFATIMFSLIQVEILGSVFSGAAFALLVPTVIGAAHVALHHEGDHFIRWWLKKLSNIGILFFALGISVMVGFSAWQAAQDAVGAISAGPAGTLGGQQVGGAVESSGFAEWVSIVPHTMLFVGLSFGMIITISFASFCLGRALQAFNILTQTPAVAKKVKARIKELNGKIASLRRLIDEEASAKRRLPFDVKVKFAREAANACWQVVQSKRAAARRKFDPLRPIDPLATAFADPAVESIPNQFKTEAAFERHLADQFDAVRLHKLLAVLTGISNNGEKS